MTASVNIGKPAKSVITEKKHDYLQNKNKKKKLSPDDLQKVVNDWLQFSGTFSGD